MSPTATKPEPVVEPTPPLAGPLFVPSRNLQQRMLAVMEAIGYIPKTGVGPEAQGSFRFARAEAVKDTVRDECVKAGVMMHVSMDGRTVEVLAGREGRNVILATVWGTLQFVNVDEPSEREMVAIHGQGLDTSDKALAKATTQAVKNGLLNAFSIPTGDDPDAEGVEAGARSEPAPRQAVPARRQPDDAIDGSDYDPPPADRADSGPGSCPKHGKPWRSGQYGWYCPARDDSEERGYCKQRPSEAWKAAQER